MSYYVFKRVFLDYTINTDYSYLCTGLVATAINVREKPLSAIKKGQSKDTDNIG
jgi:hypothetical protein